MTISRNVIVEQQSTDGNLLIETIMAEIEKVVLEITESVYQGDSISVHFLTTSPSLDSFRKTKSKNRQ